MAARHRAQRLAGPDLQERGLALLPQEGAQHVVEADGRAHVLGPVGRVGDLLGDGRLARDVGHVRHARRVQRHVGGDPRGEPFAERLHHGGVEGVRGGQRPARHRLGLQERPDGGDALRLAGQHGELGPADRADADTGDAGAFDALQHVRGGQRHRGHGPRGQLVDEAGAVGDEGERRFQGEHAGQAGGHVLAEAVSGQHRRLDPPGLDEPGERVLDREQGGLQHAGRGRGGGLGRAAEQRAERAVRRGRPGGEHLGERVGAAHEPAQLRAAVVEHLAVRPAR
ncbi:hypothetical protein GCM10020219_099360 [Nonomuraea dietziae]